ncbi:hypothetical protein RB597_002416 [Gaeumannomyces tritici]
MAVYSFYIFDRHTECIYTKQWLPPPRDEAGTAAGAGAGAIGGGGGGGGGRGKAARDSRADDAKLIFGTVFSLRNMVRKLGGDDDAFVAYRTAQYKLHFYETPTNLRFVLLTDTASMSMRNVLHQIYINLWVEYGEQTPLVCSLVKNPLSPAEHRGGEGVKNELFELGLDQFIRGLA